MAPTKVILLACGSFNPPTHMHLRMFELAKDNINRLGQYLVVGGIVSPVHDAYGKKELVPATYRCEMLKLALKSSNWIQISDWECSQETWSRTRRVLQYHQNLLNSVINDQKDSPNNNNLRIELENGYSYSNWITNDVRNTEGPVQIKLLCGADLLESFATPGLWAEEDIETIIGQHGIVVITRQGSDPHKFVYESDILTKYQHNIVIITEWIMNDVSSTKVRRALRRQESVKYLLEDSVIDFIKRHGLYETEKTTIKYNTNSNQSLIIPHHTYILTPSPSDINLLSATSSKDNIYLDLHSIKNSEVAKFEEHSKDTSKFVTFESSAETEFPSIKNKNLSNEFKLSKFANEIAFDDQCSTLETRKKVGFPEAKNFEVEDLQINSNGVIVKDKNEESEATKAKTLVSKKTSKVYEGKKISKAESEEYEYEVNFGKGNQLLRRSQSDAVMSKKSQNGETASVKIQFTKEGIKVISDKESIV